MHFSGWEKLGFGILVAAWVAFGSNFAGDMLIHAEPLETSAYQVAIADSGAEASSKGESAPMENALTLLASVDETKGLKTFGKCKSCHTVNDGGKNGVGPNLWDVVGRAKAGVAGFKYSGAMTEAGGDWSFADLDQFLLNPKAAIKGTKMSFAGLKKAGDRAAVILYLRSLSASPKPLP